MGSRASTHYTHTLKSTPRSITHSTKLSSGNLVVLLLGGTISSFQMSPYANSPSANFQYFPLQFFLLHVPPSMFPQQQRTLQQVDFPYTRAIRRRNPHSSALESPAASCFHSSPNEISSPPHVLLRNLDCI